MNIANIEKRTIKDCEVFIGSGLEREFLPRFRLAFEGGTLCVVYENDYIELACVIMRELKKGGYRVLAKCVDEEGDVSEFVRFVFCVGDGDAIVRAKQIASKLDIGWSLFVTAPTDDNVMCANAPKQVFIDQNVLINCQNEQICAGYGILLSSRVTAFENGFKRCVLDISEVPIEHAEAEEIDRCELVFRILNLSANKTSPSGAELVGKVMRALALSKGKTPRLEGEYRFLAGCVLSSLYSFFLGAPSIDCALPPCVGDDMDRLKSLAINVENRCKCIDFFDVSSYFRISYILSEYRLDLLEKLAGVDMHGVERFWRRLYKDAGYWLKSEITASEVLKCVYLAGVMSDGLLGYMYALGMMNKFV